MAHADVPVEQAYINYAYDCLEEMRHRGEEFDAGSVAVHAGAAEAIQRMNDERLAELRDDGRPLCVGRIDLQSNETYYIGRLGVKDPSTLERVVVDWRARVAKAFYQASAAQPMGLTRRRQFIAEGRRLLDIGEEIFEPSLAPSGTEVETAPVRARDALLAELTRSRGAELRDIVATIQSEQDALIREPLEGVLVIQGGPGTGKTVVGLHRAAYLLFTHREHLERRGILIVGPNEAFIQYINQVLPSLGESSVLHQSINSLAGRLRGGRVERPAIQRLKGDLRMAELISRALTDRTRPLREDEHFVTERQKYELLLTVSDSQHLIAKARAASPLFSEGRDRLRDDLYIHFYRQVEENILKRGGSAPDAASFTRQMRSDAKFQSLLDRLWPTITPAELVSELLSGPRRLARVADGLFTADEQALLLRDPAANLREEQWAVTDVPLLDEAEQQISGGGRVYGHVIVDEAQDLSPMQLRMLGRRSPAGSLTIMGDLAQSTGVWAHESWDEVVEHLPRPEGHRLAELSIGYRVPKEVMELASRILPEAAPAVRPPRAIRRGSAPVVQKVRSEANVVPSLIQTLTSRSARGLTAIIAPTSLISSCRLALENAGISFSEVRRGNLNEDVILALPRHSKGLEFDHVVVVEPKRIWEEEDQGARALYVALTRTTGDLTVLHALPLPKALTQPVAATTPRQTTVAHREKIRPLLVSLLFTGSCLHNREITGCIACTQLLDRYGIEELERILRSDFCFHMKPSTECDDCKELLQRYGDDLFTAVEERDTTRLARVASAIARDASLPLPAESLPTSDLQTDERITSDADSEVEAGSGNEPPDDAAIAVRPQSEPKEREAFSETAMVPATDGGGSSLGPVELVSQLIESLDQFRNLLMAGISLEDLNVPAMEPPKDARKHLEALSGCWPAIFEYRLSGAIKSSTRNGQDLQGQYRFLDELIEEASMWDTDGQIVVSDTGVFMVGTDRKILAFRPPATD